MKHVKLIAKEVPATAQFFCNYGPLTGLKQSMGKSPHPGANSIYGTPPLGQTWYCKG